MSRSEREDLNELAALYSAKIRDLLIRQDIGELLRDYLNPEGPYAATTFDDLRGNATGAFGAEDFLALGFLDTPLKAATYRQFSGRAEAINDLLAKIDDKRPLWELDDSTYAAADSLWRALLELDGVGVTRASKLMARKRPRLIPILDRRVREFFDGRTEEFWWPLALALREEDLRRGLVELRSEVGAGTLSELRILDIAIWMGERNPPGTVASTDE